MPDCRGGSAVRVLIVEFPDRPSAKLAVHAIRPVLDASGSTWWLEQRGERWLIGGSVPLEFEDFVAETISGLGGCEVPAGAATGMAIRR